MERSIMVAYLKTAFAVRTLVLAFAGAVLSQGVHPQSFTPSVKFCNRTIAQAWVAISYDRAESSQSTSVGWYKVQGCTCRTVLQNTLLKATEVFVLANRGWGMPNLLQPAKGMACVKKSAFNLTAENTNAKTCAASTGSWVPFTWHDTIGRPYTVNLREARQCNLMGDQ